MAKAEWTSGKANPRFIVTSLPVEAGEARAFYEGVYCQRGDMENRIKECLMDLFADRTPAITMRTNQLRLHAAHFERGRLHPVGQFVAGDARIEFGEAGVSIAVLQVQFANQVE